MSNLDETIKPFLDPATGLIMSKDGGKDNEVLNCATLDMLDGCLPHDLEYALNRFVNQTAVKVGLYFRYPGANDNSVDNYIALAALSRVLAMKIFDYGSRNLWCFDPAYPTKFSFSKWYFRFIGFRPFIKARAGLGLNIFDAFLFSLSAVFTALSAYGNTSDKCLQVLMNFHMKESHWLVEFGIWSFNQLMRRKYPKGLAELYGIYFGPDHPFTQAAGNSF